MRPGGDVSFVFICCIKLCYIYSPTLLPTRATATKEQIVSCLSFVTPLQSAQSQCRAIQPNSGPCS
jgi:hypothetical protein